MVKSRVVGHGLPSRPLPTGGTVSLPALIAAFAAEKNAGALQYANWLKIESPCPLTHAPARKLPFESSSVRFSPLYPNQIPTTAFFGRAGTTGATAGRVPLSITSGL